MNSHPLPSPWVRYPVAVFVAFVTSLLIVATFTFSLAAIHTTADSSPQSQYLSQPPAPYSFLLLMCCNFLVGLVGVLAGALCLERTERAFGSLILLVLGVGFEIAILGSAHGVFHFPRGAIATGIGGLVAVVFFFWHRPRLPTPAA